MRLLLVEDDALLGDGLRAGLSLDGYSVDWVRDGATYRLTDHFWRMVESEDSATVYGIDNLHNNVLLNPDSRVTGTDLPRRLRAAPAVQIARLAENRPEDALTRQVLAHYGARVVSDIVPLGTTVDLTRYGTELAPYMDRTAPDEIKLVDQRIDSYLRQAIPQIILASSDAQFASMQAAMMNELKRLEVDRLYEFYEGVVAKGIEASRRAHGN